MGVRARRRAATVVVAGVLAATAAAPSARAATPAAPGAVRVGAAAPSCPDSPFWSGFDAEVRARWPGRRITAAVYDTRTGCQYRYRSGERVTTASVLKIEIMAGVLLRAQQAGRPLTSTERNQVAAMIRTSDDPSANALWTSLGGTAAMASLERSLGLSETRATSPWGLTSTSAADRNELLRQLVLGQWGPFTAATRAEARRFLLDVTASQRWGITAGVPGGWKVPLKNGFFASTCCGWRVNTSGVVERPDGSAYVLTVLSDGWSSLAQGIPAVEFVARGAAAWNRVAVGPHASAARFAREARRDVLGAPMSWAAEQAIADRIGADAGRAGDEVERLLADPSTAATSDVVLRLHLVGLGALPSPSTWSSTVADVRSGRRSTGDVAEAIATSPAFGGTGLDAGAFVDLAHQRAFGRLPAPDDRAWWVARLEAGARRGDLLLSLAQTATVRWHTGRRVQVASAHLTLLRRLPTEAEHAAWEDALWDGTSLGALVDGVLASPAYRDRFR